MKTALVLIDIQNYYFAGGRNQLSGSEEAAVKAAGILALFRKKNLPVIHVQHITNRPGATFFLPGTFGAEIYKDVKPLENEAVVEKNFPDSFFRTTLSEKLAEAGAEKLVVCGMMTHMCVDTTVRAAKNHGYEVTLISDACATKNLCHDGKEIPAATVHASFMAALDKMFAEVITAEKFLSKEGKE